MPKVVVTGRLVLIFRDFSKLDLMSAVVGRPFLVVVELFSCSLTNDVLRPSDACIFTPNRLYISLLLGCGS